MDKSARQSAGVSRGQGLAKAERASKIRPTVPRPLTRAWAHLLVLWQDFPHAGLEVATTAHSTTHATTLRRRQIEGEERWASVTHGEQRNQSEAARRHRAAAAREAESPAVPLSRLSHHFVGRSSLVGSLGGAYKTCSHGMKDRKNASDNCWSEDRCGCLLL